MKLTSGDALGLGTIDGVIPEPIGGAHRDHKAMAMSIKGQILDALAELEVLEPGTLMDLRLQKFLDMGAFEEKS